MVSKHRPNVGYYGRLSHVVNGELRTMYATPEYPHHMGLFEMAGKLRELAQRMNADAYQLRRCVQGNDRGQGCVICLTHQAAVADKKVRL